MIYIINFLVLAVDAFFERFIKSKVFLYISSILLVCFAGFRGFNVGPDTPVYVSFYEETLAKIGNSYFEPGYHFLEHFCSFLGLSTTFFLTIVSLLTMLLLVSGFKYFTAFPSSILLYYYARFFMNRNMGQIRAALAASIILFSLRYVQKKQLFTFMFFCLLATLFHKSALIALLIYPFNLFVWRYLKTKKGIVEFTILILILVYLLSIFGTGLIYRIFDVLSSAYVDSNNDNAKQSLGINNPVIWMQVLLTIFAILFLNNNSDRKNEVIITTYLLSTILLILLSHYYVLAGRLSSMLATVEPLLFLKVTDHFFGNKTISYFIFLILSIFIFWLINIKSGVLSPYAFSF